VTHMFNWHQEPEGFLKWMLVQIIAETHFGNDDEDELFNKISAATSNFDEVELGITINGHEIPTKKFVLRLEQQMQFQAEIAAKELLDTDHRLSDVLDILDDFKSEVKGLIRQKAKDLNLDLYEH